MNTNSNNFRHTPENGDSMLHILICDDDTAFTNTLQSAIAALPDYNRRQMQTICVNDPRVLTKTDIQRADLVFLDIDMGDINGMKLARQMRAIHKDFVLIFVTNYGEYAAEGYEVNAFRFLPKLQLAEKLPSYFRQALAACRSRTRTLNVMCEGEGTNIVLDDLVYAEIDERMVKFHMADVSAPVRKSRMALRELENQLEDDGFLRIHNSFLVNMNYISSLQTNGVTLTIGQTLPISLHGYRGLRRNIWYGEGAADGICVEYFSECSTDLVVHKTVGQLFHQTF